MGGPLLLYPLYVWKQNLLLSGKIVTRPLSQLYLLMTSILNAVLRIIPAMYHGILCFYFITLDL